MNVNVVIQQIAESEESYRQSLGSNYADTPMTDRP